MKLISLYIENFGGLSHYGITFEDGITVIREPNGFGKTTLAEFIRAMFYGFPRKAKTLDKSRREKYTPWQGGAYGGNLVFELDGARYRMERTFGATPKGDSFTLIDLKNNKKSTAFSANIGLEIFKLDADSFERSTYMPQLRDGVSLTTDSIQAKLGDLVEDTNDIGNYDKAVAALKNARSAFIPYRGSGGSVAQAQGEISRLQEQIARVGAKNAELRGISEEIAHLEAEIEACRAQKTALEQRMDAAAQAENVAAVQREHARLNLDVQKLTEQLAALDACYPRGIPSEDALEGARRVASDAATLAAQTVTTQGDLDSKTYLEKNASRFAGGVPDAAQIEHFRALTNEMAAAQSELDAAGLNASEQREYAALLDRQQAGEFDEARFERLDAAENALTKKQIELENLDAQDSDRRKFEELRRYFAAGLPTEDALRTQQSKLELANAQRAEKKPARVSAGAVVTGVLAALGIGGGIWLMLAELLLYGGIALALGTALLIGAVVLQLRAGKRKDEMPDLEDEVHAFTARYTTTMPLLDALYEIRAQRESYLELEAALHAHEARGQTLAAEITALRGQLADALKVERDFDDAIRDLHVARSRFEKLDEEAAQAQVKISALRQTIAAQNARITAFLSPYFADIAPQNFHSLLSALARDGEHYARAQEQVAAWQARMQEYEQKAAQYDAQLAAFFGKFGIARASDVREQLLRIRDDSRDHATLLNKLSEKCAETEIFARENAQLLSVSLPENRETTAELRAQEQHLTAQAEQLSDRLARSRQRHEQLQHELDELPALRDALAEAQETRAAGEKKAAILDDTLSFLDRARENLQNSYLGPVRTRFEGYMAKLLEEQHEQILLTPDLDVQLERGGQARALGYFSAGQTDAVMLCMRFALVDALFPAVKPFVILDDPFVNLDDARTAQALCMLQTLAKDGQIIYLTCNSSRDFA